MGRMKELLLDEPDTSLQDYESDYLFEQHMMEQLNDTQAQPSGRDHQRSDQSP